MIPTNEIVGTIHAAVEEAVQHSLADKPPLTDPWFEPHFYGECSATSLRYLPSIEGTQGLMLWCPCGYGKPEFPLEGGRPHAIMVPFSNPRNAPLPPPNHGPVGQDGKSHPRWTMEGSSLEDLTVNPSILVNPKQPCWHGFIQHGKVT